jgi:hypothetical protein
LPASGAIARLKTGQYLRELVGNAAAKIFHSTKRHKLCLAVRLELERQSRNRRSYDERVIRRILKGLGYYGIKKIN